MANYEVSTTNFDVTQNVANDYSIGLNYEAPSKGVQYQNLILDSLTSLFDGSRTVFPLKVSGDAYEALNDIMIGQADDDEIAELLTCLANKSESISEINGMVKVMQEQCLKVGQVDYPLLDTCGTGGATIKTFNVSTAAAFVASAAGANVAKHGDRAMTSKSGSADFLEALGAKIDLNPNSVSQCIKKTGIGFMFAQAFIQL